MSSRPISESPQTVMRPIPKRFFSLQEYPNDPGNATKRLKEDIYPFTSTPFPPTSSPPSSSRSSSASSSTNTSPCESPLSPTKFLSTDGSFKGRVAFQAGESFDVRPTRPGGLKRSHSFYGDQSACTYALASTKSASHLSRDKTRLVAPPLERTLSSIGVPYNRMTGILQRPRSRISASAPTSPPRTSTPIPTILVTSSPSPPLRPSLNPIQRPSLNPIQSSTRSSTNGSEIYTPSINQSYVKTPGSSVMVPLFHPPTKIDEAGVDEMVERVQELDV